MPAFNCYPDPHQAKLKKLYADWRKVDPDQIFVGVGSDEAIDMLMRMVCVPAKDSILICPPTYGMYKVSSAVNDLKVISVPLTEDFQIRPKEILKAVTDTTKLIWLCSPNNPTANDIDEKLITEVLDSDFKGLVVVDEAYVDFSPRGSLASWTKKYPQLVVLQTFSKSWGLAGVRCGVAISSPDIVGYMNRIKAPYNMNVMTSQVVRDCLQNLPKMLQTVEEIKKEKKRVKAALESIPHVIKVFPSSANFFLFRVKSHSKEIYRTIAESGVVIRYRGDNHGCSECLRATVGRPEDNDAFLKKFKEIIAKVVKA
uniref:histidinol-phosphate transaminase n=1 Tax=Lotharella oceanica TaxID=641309 RepID=A0A7S2TT69_9EUKA